MTKTPVNLSRDQVNEVPEVGCDAAQASKKDIPKCAASEYRPINHITLVAPFTAIFELVKSIRFQGKYSVKKGHVKVAERLQSG